MRALILLLLCLPGLAGAEGRVWRSSYESLEPFKRFFAIAPPHLGTAWHALSTERARSGEFSHKAWLDGANPARLGADGEHRAYLTVQLNKLKGGGYKTPCLVEWWVWTDLDLAPGRCDWVSLATFTSDKGGDWRRVVEVRLDSQGRLALHHVPTARRQDWAFQESSRGLPRFRWVRLSAYLDFDAANGQAILWMDGRRMSQGPLRGMDAVLRQLHLGLYADRRCRQGAVYNDDVAIYEAGSFVLADFGLQGSGAVNGVPPKVEMKRSVVSVRKRHPQ